MDRNGKKPKANAATDNSERSDMKGSRDTLGKTAASARVGSAVRAGGARDASTKAPPKGRTP